MTTLFWIFMMYSFIGFVLEVLFARATGNPKRDRKCLLFLPLCPVYGLGVLLILALPEPVQAHPLALFLLGGLAASAVEFLMAHFYQRVAGVRFWDYRHLRFQVGGQVSLLFTGIWGFLSLLLVYLVQPQVAPLIGAIPPPLALPAAVLFLLDSTLTVLVLRRAGHTDALKWYALRRGTQKIRAEGSPSAPGPM